MATLKTLGTFAVIIGCFAIVYPRFLHPLVLRAFGMHNSVGKEEDQQYPPHMRHGGPLPKDGRPPSMPNDPKDIRQHMRPGPHPGMRAAAEMQKQQAQGTGRGMMGIVLPMYAIGICVYLIYTLFKVFNKRGKGSDPYSKPRYEAEGEARLDRLGFPKGLRGGAEQDQTEVQDFLRKKQQERDLEDLLVKMDDTKTVSEDEMRALQKRLEETEAQMSRILQAMQTMQSRVGTVAGEGITTAGIADGGDGSVAGQDEAETVGAASPNDSQESPKTGQPTQSTASSPDTESYDLVKDSTLGTTDASPCSETSSPSSFEQINKDLVGEGEAMADTEGEGEDIVLDQQEKEQEDSGVRHRKSGHAEED